MKLKSDGPEPVSDSDERPSGTTHERVIRGPSGFRVISETTTEHMIGSLDPNDRIHMVVIDDPGLGMLVGSVTVIRAATLGLIDEACANMKDAFHVGIRKAAYAQVCLQIWGGEPPRGTRLEQVFEISKRELIEIMKSEADFRIEATRDAS